MKINTYYNEDCLDTMKKMPDNFIDLVITSPPYDDLRTYDGYSFDFENTAKSLYRIMKTGGVIVWIVSDQTKDNDESGTSFRQVLYFKKIGFKLIDTMIWEKRNPAPCNPNLRYRQSFEYMFVISKGKIKTTNFITDVPNISVGKIATKRIHTIGKGYSNSDKKMVIGEYKRRSNIWKYSIGSISVSDSLAHEHPAIFPEKLVRDHIISWSNEGDLVYDPFSGSGTTLIVARDFKRNYVGSEISSKYCEIIEQRLNPEQTRLFE